jgi:hypothetical protein
MFVAQVNNVEMTGSKHVSLLESLGRYKRFPAMSILNSQKATQDDPSTTKRLSSLRALQIDGLICAYMQGSSMPAFEYRFILQVGSALIKSENLFKIQHIILIVETRTAFRIITALCSVLLMRVLWFMWYFTT